ncbi:MAG: acetylornithine/N-succinyldiaminopimelate aminotransferase [Saprospiraceae bacterium]|jgi:acetylornithine/N-succinyldiaminopimelate aminotransferase
MKLFDVYPLFDIEPIKGKGAYVYDKNDTAYLDFYTGHAVVSIGHSHPHYVKKLTQQLQQLGFYSNSIQNNLQQQLVEQLSQISGLKDYQLFLCNSGAEAVENALKVASHLNGKTKVIAFEKAFHGRTAAAINVTDMKNFKPAINSAYPVEFHAFNQTQTVRESLEKGDTCAIIVEGIQGIGGIHVASDLFLQELSNLSTQYNVPLILDEIQSGYGRSGKFFSFQYAGIQPDIITMAKGMGNGFPVGGVLFKNNIQPAHGLAGSTFGGNHLACAAAIAVLEVLENEKLIDNAKQIGAYLMDQLTGLPQVTEVRGRGLMIGLEFDFPIKELRNNLLFEEKVFTGSSSNPNTMRLLPPLSITKKEADLFVQKLSACLEFGLRTENCQFFV